MATADDTIWFQNLLLEFVLVSLSVMFAIIFLDESILCLGYVIAPARLASAQFVCFVKLWFGKYVYMRTSVYCKYHMALHLHCYMRSPGQSLRAGRRAKPVQTRQPANQPTRQPGNQLEAQSLQPVN